MNIIYQIEQLELKNILVSYKNKLKKINDNPLSSPYFNIKQLSSKQLVIKLEYYNYLIPKTKNKDICKSYIIKYLLINANIKNISSNLYFILNIIKKNILINNNQLTKEKIKTIIKQLSNNSDIYHILNNNFSFDELKQIKVL